MPWRDEQIRRYCEFVDRVLGEQPASPAEIKRIQDLSDRILDALRRIRDSDNGYKLSQEMLTILICFDAEDFLLFPTEEELKIRNA